MLFRSSGRCSGLIANWFGTVTNDVAQLTVEVPYLRAEYVATNRVYRLTLPQSPELLDSPRLLQSSPDLIHWNTLESIPSFSNPQPYRDFAITNRLFFRVIPRP